MLNILQSCQNMLTHNTFRLQKENIYMHTFLHFDNNGKKTYKLKHARVVHIVVNCCFMYLCSYAIDVSFVELLIHEVQEHSACVHISVVCKQEYVDNKSM